MLDFDRLFGDLARYRIDLPRERTESLLHDKLSGTGRGKHGKLVEWQRVLNNLPFIETERSILNEDAVATVADNVSDEDLALLQENLLALLPWRKGPFDLFGIHIDAEWRSDLKWNRVSGVVSPLAGRRVLDVGCGNGYYAFRMKGQGADFVLGIDPTIGHVVQFLAVQKYLRQDAVWALPCRLEELPEADCHFDTTFSMGVLYHQRDALDHLTRLRNTLRQGGELVLETLIAPGDSPECIVPEDRYARMRNVWALPTIARLKQWLSETRFSQCRVVDINETGLDEQRTTTWMPFESLDKALNPLNPSQTIEGLPRPMRAVIVGTRT